MNGVLDKHRWKKVVLKEYFTVIKASGYKVKELIEGNINYVARAKINNGVTHKCGNINIYEKNTITIHNEWSDKWVSFFQTEDYVTDGMIYILKPLFNITRGGVYLFPLC